MEAAKPIKSQEEIEKNEREEEIRKKEKFLLEKHLEGRKFDEEKIKKWSNSILEEMNACLKFRKIDIDTINNLKDFYKKQDYKYDNGLIEATVFIKRPSDKKVQETMKLWFYMVENYAKRDQLSFNYCISKTNLKVKWINEKVFDNMWFRWHQHTFSKYPNDYMIYFGDIDKYDYKKQYSDNYIIKNNKYIIDTNVIDNCKEIFVEISNSLVIRYNIEKVTPKCIIDKQNTIEYLEETYFYKNPGFIILKGDFKKGERIHIEISFELVREDEKNEIIEYLVNDRQVYKNVYNSYNDTKMTLDNVLNSTSWKITKPIRKITEKIKK